MMKNGYNLSASDNLRPGSPKVLKFQPGELDPGNYTLQFAFSDPNGVGNILGGEVVKAKATIIWKVSGIPVQRVVDCVNGLSITGTAESVDVTIQDASSISAPSKLTAIEYTVAVTLGRGVRANTQQPPTFSPYTAIQLAPGASTTVDIPDNSGAISVHAGVSPITIGSAIGAYDVLIGQVGGVSTLLSLCDPRQSDWVPLLPGSKKITLFASAAAPAPGVQFNLSFGIDG